MNQGWTYADSIRSKAAGQTVLDYYTQRYTHSTQQQWRTRIEQGQILLDDRPTTSHTVVAAGQTLTYHRAPWQEPDAPLNFDVLYEDEHLWAISKPSGLPVLPGGGFLEHTLLHQLRSRYVHEAPVPVHRLGRGTSGVMLIAKSQSARAILARQFRVRTAKAISPPLQVPSGPSPQPPLGKIYRALIGPTTPSDLSDRFTCLYPIGKLPYPGLPYLYGHSPTGLPSRSDCRILQRTPQSTLVEVTITTGRPHQIRIHLAAAGYPMLGDPLYAPGGTPIPNGTAMPGEGGYHLHAHILRFPHPHTGKPLCIEAPPPKALCLQ